MSLAITFRGFLGEAEHDFALTGAMLAELERKTGTGIGALMQRTVTRDFRFSDLAEVIRLGLIGPGTTSPAEAARLVRLYVEDRPLEEFLPLALGILDARWFGGRPAEPKADPAPEPKAAPVPVEPVPALDAPSHPDIGSE